MTLAGVSFSVGQGLHSCWTAVWSFIWLSIGGSLVAKGVNGWNEACDKPLQVFLVVEGITWVFILPLVILMRVLQHRTSRPAQRQAEYKIAPLSMEGRAQGNQELEDWSMDSRPRVFDRHQNVWVTSQGEGGGAGQQQANVANPVSNAKTLDLGLSDSESDEETFFDRPKWDTDQDNWEAQEARTSIVRAPLGGEAELFPLEGSAAMPAPAISPAEDAPLEPGANGGASVVRMVDGGSDAEGEGPTSVAVSIAERPAFATKQGSDGLETCDKVCLLLVQISLGFALLFFCIVWISMGSVWVWSGGKGSDFCNAELLFWSKFVLILKYLGLSLTCCCGSLYALATEHHRWQPAVVEL